MSDPNDDMQYITRRELREELAPIHAVLKLIVERMATKDDLARFATKDELAACEARLRGEIANTEGRLMEHVSREVAQHTHASAEETRAMIRALDDKYSDVHPRLERLEAERVRPRTRRAPPRRTRRTRR